MRLISLLLLVLAGASCGGRAANDPRSVFAIPATPSISALTPSSNPANSPPFTLMIRGNNFGTDTVAFWNGVPQQTTIVDSGQLQVLVTATDMASPGLNHIFVRTAGFNSNTVDFNVTPQ